MNYYNEFDPKAAEWLRELIKQGHLPNGTVDERSITDVAPSDLEGFTQCHFFAGIGGWSLALRLAGWPDDRPVWTGSCPCQPFSSAGKGKGNADPRHLWPAYRWLIAQCRPSVVFGEQVAAKAGRTWLSGVRDDLEALGYGVGAADICAAGVNAPHIRQRLWWVGGLRNPTSLGPCGGQSDQTGEQSEVLGSGHASVDRVANDTSERQHGRQSSSEPTGRTSPETDCADGRLDDCESERRGVRAPADHGTTNAQIYALDNTERGAADGRRSDPWSRAIYWPCRDSKWRRVPARIGSDGKAEIEPGLFPLADGLPQGVALVRTPRGDKKIMRNAALKGSGNAIVPQVAAVFIEAFDEANH